MVLNTNKIYFIFLLCLCFSCNFCQNSNLDLLKDFANKGVPWAQYELSNLYYQGHLVKKNDLNAYQYMLKSAKQGYNKAAYGLGVYYNTGVGCSIDKVQSLAWMQKSLDSGYQKAQTYINQLLLELDTNSIVEAEQLLKRTLAVSIKPKWVYINSDDKKIKTNSQGNEQVFLESYLYSKKEITFSKNGYISQTIAVEFGKDQDLSIELLKSTESQNAQTTTSTSDLKIDAPASGWIYY